MGKFLIIMLTLFGNTLSGHGKEIRVISGDELSPYMIPNKKTKTESSKEVIEIGVSHEVLKKALAKVGHTLNITFIPLARVPSSFLSQTDIDAAAPIRPSSGVEGHYSNIYMDYQNVGASLKERTIRVDSIQDLSKFNVLAFQNAHKYLGEDYAKITKNNKKYGESANELNRVARLCRGRTDVIIGDKYIHAYSLKKKYKCDKPLKVHPLFPKTPYHVIFKDKKIRDDFNRGLALLKKSGEYKKILSRLDTYL